MNTDSKRPRVGRWVALVAVILALGALACGPLSSTTVVVTATPDAAPVDPTPYPTLVLPTAVDDDTTDSGTTDGGGATGDVGELVVENLSAQTVCYLYVSPTDAEDWGDDQLGSDEVIDSGESFSVFDIPVGTYDLRADDCNSEVLVEQYGAKVTASGLTWTLNDEGGVALTLVNQSSQAICYVYFSPTDAEDWGPDQLDSDQIIAAGEQVVFNGIPAGMYDLRVEACESEQAVEDYGLDLSGDFEYTVTD